MKLLMNRIQSNRKSISDTSTQTSSLKCLKIFDSVKNFIEIWLDEKKKVMLLNSMSKCKIMLL